jgi:hypothetical protein
MRTLIAVKHEELATPNEPDLNAAFRVTVFSSTCRSPYQDPSR